MTVHSNNLLRQFVRVDAWISNDSAELIHLWEQEVPVQSFPAWQQKYNYWREKKSRLW